MSGLRGRWVAGIGIGIALVVAGVAVAARSASTGEIHACYSKRTGVLRVGASCRSGERPLAWNRSGPQGPQGAVGPTGSDGASGASGSARAYAYVHGSVGSPSFATAKTKGFTAVSEPAHGVYCLTAPGIDPATTAPAVTAVYNSGFAGIPTSAKLEALGSDCASGQFEVLTQDIQSGSEVNSPNLDFTIVVP